MLRHRCVAAKLLLGAVLFLAGCLDTSSDSPLGPPAELLRRSEVSAVTTCDAESSASDLIDCLFPPPGLRNAAQVQLSNILRQHDRGQLDDATGMMFDLVDFVLAKREDGRLLDPRPLGQDAATRLLLDALFEAVGMDPPHVPEGALQEDGAVAVVSPLGGAVFTGTRLFGLDFAENAVGSDVLVALSRVADPASAGEGPLPTDLDQYGPFYELRVSPVAEAVTGVTLGLCHFDTGPLAPPDDPAVRARLRIARTVPGTDDEIEVLARAPAPDFIDCSDVTLVAGGRTGTILARGTSGPETMSVIVGTVDPESVGGGGPLPDLIVESMRVLPTTPVSGNPLTIEAVVRNVGEASAPPSQLRLSHAGSGAIDVLLPVGDLMVDEAETVTYSTTLAAGTYADVLAWADHPGEVEELLEDNNDRTLSFSVVPAATISGRVFVDGEGLAGVTVTVTGAATLTTTTDAGGTYTAVSLPPGNYTVSISGLAYGDFPYTSASLTVAPGESAVVNFDGVELWASPVAPGPALTWTVTEPDVPTEVCNGQGPDPCEFGGSTVTVRAVATGPSGAFANPWGAAGNVYFYYSTPTSGPVFLAKVSAASATLMDDGTTRYYTWTTTFDAEGVPAEPVSLTAVGVDSSHNAFATPDNTDVTVWPGTLGGAN